MKSNGQSTRKSFNSLRVRVQNYCYNLNQKLGSGYSSQVFKGWDDRDGKTVAIKVINLHKVRERRLEGLLTNELKLLKQLRHQNLVHYIDALMTVNNCYIITQFCQEGDMASILSKKGRMSTDETMKVISDLVSSIHYLHQKEIIHRDIKPQNILLHNSKVQLADFGFAIKIDKIIKDGYKIGTPLYMSPQTLFQKQYSKKSDVWSLGITMYELFEGRPPWQIRDEKQLKQLMKQEVMFQHLNHQGMKNIILRCLSYDKEDRCSIQEVLSKIEEIIGVKSDVIWQIKEDKQNNENTMNVNESEEDEQRKKSKRSNYAMLKWMINYSRFVAKLLPKLQKIDIAAQIRDPLIEMTARCLHNAISKLHRIEQLHGELGLTEYNAFKRSSRFSKIRAVTQEYHKKYLLILSHYSFSYEISSSISLKIQQNYLDALEKLYLLDISDQKKGQIIQNILILFQTNIEAKNIPLIALIHKINFQKLIENSNKQISLPSMQDMKERQKMILETFGRKVVSEQNQTESN